MKNLTIYMSIAYIIDREGKAIYGHSLSMIQNVGLDACLEDIRKESNADSIIPTSITMLTKDQYETLMIGRKKIQQ